MRKCLALAIALLTCTRLPVLASVTPDDGAPPKNLVPSKMKLAELFRRHRLASGHLRAGTGAGLSADYSISFGGVSGTLLAVERGEDSRTDTMLGALHTARGTFNGKRWSMNEDGQVIVESGIHKGDEIDASLLRRAAERSFAGMTILGESASPAAYVVRVLPEGGRLEYVFYDKKTMLVDRIERLREGRREAATFDDYRNTQGITTAWHTRIDDGRPNNVQEEHLTSIRYGAQSAASVAMPAPLPPLVSAATFPAALEAKLSGDRIILSAKMGGHKVDFQLDSGASGIVIDRDVAAALKFEQQGLISGETAGTYVESDVTIPKMQIGAIVVTNAHAKSLPFTMWTTDGTPVAGLMGFDFIHDVILHIDYLHGTAEALAADSAVPADARRIPIALDDNVPVLLVNIGNARNLHFVLDTGADRSMLFTQFARTHPGDIADQGLGTAMQAAFPFVDDFAGVGGTVATTPVQVGPLSLGPWSFAHWLFYLTHNAPSFEAEDYDGLIGQDVLRNYDVWFDYQHQCIYLRPNERFHQRWG